MSESSFCLAIAVIALLFTIGSCVPKTININLVIKEQKPPVEFSFEWPERGQALPFTRPFEREVDQ